MLRHKKHLFQNCDHSNKCNSVPSLFCVLGIFSLSLPFLILNGSVLLLNLPDFTLPVKTQTQSLSKHTCILMPIITLDRNVAFLQSMDIYKGSSCNFYNQHGSNSIIKFGLLDGFHSEVSQTKGFTIKWPQKDMNSFLIDNGSNIPVLRKFGIWHQLVSKSCFSILLCQSTIELFSWFNYCANLVFDTKNCCKTEDETKVLVLI